MDHRQYPIGMSSPLTLVRADFELFFPFLYLFFPFLFFLISDVSFFSDVSSFFFCEFFYSHFFSFLVSFLIISVFSPSKLVPPPCKGKGSENVFRLQKNAEN